MDVVPAEQTDVASWIEIVREVEPLFGPMPEFDATLLRSLRRGTALCVRDVGSGAVLGGVLFGVRTVSSGAECTIDWLAVRTSARGAGVGAALVEAVLRRFPRPSRVWLDTFGEDRVEGRPARRLYQRFGFQAAELRPPGPEGGTRQRFRLALGAEGASDPAPDTGDPFDLDPARRTALQQRVVAALGADPRVERVELIGSLGRGAGDRYSDIDLVAHLVGTTDRDFFFDLPAIMRSVGPLLIDGWGFAGFPHGYIGTYGYRGYPLFWQIDVVCRSDDHVDASDLQQVSRWEQLFKVWLHAAKLVARADDAVEQLRTYLAKRLDTASAAEGGAAERLAAELDLLAEVGRMRGAPFEELEAGCRELLTRVLGRPSASAGG